MYSPPKRHAVFQETGAEGAYLWGSQNSASGSCAKGLLARPKKAGEARPACDSDLFYLVQSSREVSLPGQERSGGGRLWKSSSPVGPLGRSCLGPPWRQEEAHPGFLCFPYQGAGPCSDWIAAATVGPVAECPFRIKEAKQVDQTGLLCGGCLLVSTEVVTWYCPRKPRQAIYERSPCPSQR